MDGGRAILVVIDPGHEALRGSLVVNEDDPTSHLRTEEGGFLGAVSALCSAGAMTGAGRVAISLVLELGEIVRQPQTLDRVWSLRVSGRAVVSGHVGVHARGARGGAGYGRVVVGGSHKKGVDAVGRRVIHGARLPHRRRGVGAASWERSAEGGGNFGGEDGGGWGEDVLLGDDTKKSLGKAYTRSDR